MRHALLMLLLPFAAHAETAEQALTRFVDGVQTFEARFEQVQKNEKGEVLQRTSGRMALARPGRFDWRYEKPYAQRMVCDGRSIWLYDPDLKQVTVREASDALAGTPAELLGQRANLASRFRIEGGEGEPATLRTVRLVPKSKEGDFQFIEMVLAGGLPQSMRFLDQLGSLTEVRFTESRANVAVDAARFRFTPPEGTEIVRASAEPDSCSASPSMARHCGKP